METVLEKTTIEDRKIAQASITAFIKTSQKLLKGDAHSVEIKIQETGDFFTIPKKAFSLLSDILSNMAQGKSLTLIAADTDVSTQQAADMLNVSRPHLVKLLEEGKIPFKKAGTHRRIEMKNLLTYRERLKDNRNEKLNFLAAQAQELNMGY